VPASPKDDVDRTEAPAFVIQDRRRGSDLRAFTVRVPSTRAPHDILAVYGQHRQHTGSWATLWRLGAGATPDTRPAIVVRAIGRTDILRGMVGALATHVYIHLYGHEWGGCGRERVLEKGAVWLPRGSCLSSLPDPRAS